MVWGGPNLGGWGGLKVVAGNFCIGSKANSHTRFLFPLTERSLANEVEKKVEKWQELVRRREEKEEEEREEWEEKEEEEREEWEEKEEDPRGPYRRGA